MDPSWFFSYPVYDAVIIFKKYPLSRAPTPREGVDVDFDLKF